MCSRLLLTEGSRLVATVPGFDGASANDVVKAVRYFPSAAHLPVE